MEREHTHVRLEDILEQRALAGELVVAGSATVELCVEVKPELVTELEDLTDPRGDLGLEGVVERAVQLDEVRRVRPFLRLDARQRDGAMDREVEVVPPQE